MKCSIGISNFLEEISSFSHSVVFLYCFVLIAEEGFLISSCYSLELPSLAFNIYLLIFKNLYFGHLMQKADSLEKTLMWGKIEGKRRRGRQDEMVGWHH